MNEAKADYCEHEWDSDAPVRVCLRCGEIRGFPAGDLNPRVLWQGRDKKNDPRQLPKFDKAYITGVAKRYGVAKFAELTGIPSKVLRAWVGAYCRKSFRWQLATEQKLSKKKPGRPPKPGPVAPRAILKPPEIITLTKFDVGKCQICDAELVQDADYKPPYLLIPHGKFWLCGVCAEGVAKLFKALGIPYQVKGDEDNA